MKIKIKKQLDKNEKQLDTNSKSLKSISYFSQLSTTANELFEKIKKEKNDIDSEKLVCVKTDGTISNFNEFKSSLALASNIYRKKSLLKDAENKKKRNKNIIKQTKKV